MFSRDYFGKTEAVSEEKKRRQMACLLDYTMTMPAPDRLNFELGLKGIFRADLVVGNDAARKFVLIDFEDATQKSLFDKGPKQYRYWSAKLEHGSGQIIDWACAKNTNPAAPILVNTFEGRVHEDCYVVVCGRNPPIGSLEDERFNYRKSLKMLGVTFQLYTYDNMVDAMSSNVDALLL